ncbi:hypothetical protein Tco_0199663 [Tanacetum coccineum]
MKMEICLKPTSKQAHGRILKDGGEDFRYSDTERLSRSDEVLKLKNFKKDATLKLSKSTNQEWLRDGSLVMVSAVIIYFMLPKENYTAKVKAVTTVVGKCIVNAASNRRTVVITENNTQFGSRIGSDDLG